MKVGIDFDRVLFRTDEFNEYLKQETGLHHVEGDVHDSHGCYSPGKHAELCGIDVEEVYDALQDLERFLYGDVEELERLKPRHRLVIVTRGEQRFQEAKIRQSGAETLFERVHVVQDRAKDVDGVEFLVDDRQEEIDRAGIPGMVFDRDKNTAEDIVKEIREKE